MRRTLAISVLAWALSAGGVPAVYAQLSTPTAAAGNSAGGAANAGASSSGAAQATLVRDPRTGRLYRQEVQTVEQPVTRWQRKVVDRTITVPQTVIENQQVPQTTYVAKTEYVLQQRLKGWWNPFVQPTYAYEYVPVTRWVPQTQMVTQQVASVKMVPRTEQIAVDEPVQSTERVQRLVMTEVDPAASSIAPLSGASATQLATVRPANPMLPAAGTLGGHPSLQTQPLIARVPILSQQRVLPWQPGTLLTAPVSQLRSIVRATPLPAAGQTNYGAAMNVASRPASSWSRDQNQSGMPATVVR
ncbi:MAG: hypothetical protein ACTHOU_02880 [Aureliella sp.]